MMFESFTLYATAPRCDPSPSPKRQRLLVCLQPSQFEQCLVQMLHSLKEPLEVKAGEINVRRFTSRSQLPPLFTCGILKLKKILCVSSDCRMMTAAS